MGLKQKFDDLDPKQKKIVIWSFIGIGILVVTITGYNSRTERAKIVAARKTTTIALQPDLIKKTMLREQRIKLKQLEEKIDKIASRKQLEVEEVVRSKRSRKNSNPDKNGESDLPVIPDVDLVASKAGSFQLHPGKQTGERRLPRPLHIPPPPAKDIKMVGEISVLSNPDMGATTATGQEQADKKKGRTVYLPPSFMEAQLLTGFDASTSGKGQNNPEPLLLRIQTPAVLPNDIKANLSGCFVIAEAVGRLDKERADVRLVSLSCLSNEGSAIIDTPIKGFVTDSDSKVGLSGRVVSRMGAAAARAVVAGFFGGMGDMLKAAATTTSTSPLGTTSTVDSSQIAKYSLGGGLSEGANNLSDFYLALAKQTTPIIEVGAAKKITVIISEGKDLEIRERNDEQF